MGTSEQIEIGSKDQKRTTSLHHKHAYVKEEQSNLKVKSKEEPVIVIADTWHRKKQVSPEHNPPRAETTQARLFEPANNVDRKKQDGCMNKIKIERAVKLDIEDRRGKSYDVLSGANVEKSVWVGAMGKQADNFEK